MVQQAEYAGDRDALPPVTPIPGETTTPSVFPGSLPFGLKPMLPAPTREPFDSTEHAFELAWEGLRVLASVDRGQVRIQDCYGRDVSSKYPELRALPDDLNGSGHMLDGEIVSLTKDGRPDFSALQPRITADPREAEVLAAAQPVTLQVFDILYADGRPVMNEPLRTRKRMLRQVVRTQRLVAVSDYVERDGVAFFEAARQHGLAGVVAKRLESRYWPGGHSRDWQIVRVYPKDEFAIGGFTYGGPLPGRGVRRRDPFHSLLLGQYDRWGELRYCAEVTGEFDAPTAARLSPALDRLGASRCPFVTVPRTQRLVFWCEPVLAATIAYAERTAEGRLSFPRFERLRLDVPADACRLPEPLR